MNTLAKVLHEGGKGSTKLGKGLAIHYSPNTPLDEHNLAKEVKNLSPTEQRQLSSMKFKDADLALMVRNALDQITKAPAPATTRRGERY